MFPKVSETLSNQGFQIQKLSDEQNPVYAIKFEENQPSIICFSKAYFDDFNPKNNFAAILTCTNADEGCPMVLVQKYDLLSNMTTQKRLMKRPK